jgi:thiol:disulfide interchange protein DsbD
MKFFLFLLAFAFSVSTNAQNEEPVDWSFSAKKINATTYEIHMTANIEKDWHIYSQTTPDGGPVATAISFNKNPLVKLSGKAREVGKLEQHFEELFDVQVKQFSNQVDFVQTITVKPGIKTVIAGSDGIYMACTERNCLPPRTQKFSLQISK